MQLRRDGIQGGKGNLRAQGKWGEQGGWKCWGRQREGFLGWGVGFGEIGGFGWGIDFVGLAKGFGLQGQLDYLGSFDLATFEGSILQELTIFRLGVGHIFTVVSEDSWGIFRVHSLTFWALIEAGYWLPPIPPPTSPSPPPPPHPFFRRT